MAAVLIPAGKRTRVHMEEQPSPIERDSKSRRMMASKRVESTPVTMLDLPPDVLKIIFEKAREPQIGAVNRSFRDINEDICRMSLSRSFDVGPSRENNADAMRDVLREQGLEISLENAFKNPELKSLQGQKIVNWQKRVIAQECGIANPEELSFAYLANKVYRYQKAKFEEMGKMRDFNRIEDLWGKLSVNTFGLRRNDILREEYSNLVKLCKYLDGGIEFLWDNEELLVDDYLQKIKVVRKWFDDNKQRFLEVINLDLSLQQLTCLPKEILLFENLKELNLYGNRLSVLPDWINGLRHLEELSISKNGLIRLPSTIQDLHELKVLNVASNQLRDLPPELGNCQALEIVQLSENRFTQLPVAIRRLVNLKCLGLSENQIEELPDEVAFRGLDRLLVARNRLTQLPEWVTEVPLTHLYLSQNRLAHLCDLRPLVTLISFSLSGNPLTRADGLDGAKKLVTKAIVRCAKEHQQELAHRPSVTRRRLLVGFTG